jgi:hypothetical protein
MENGPGSAACGMLMHLEYNKIRCASVCRETMRNGAVNECIPCIYCVASVIRSFSIRCPDSSSSSSRSINTLRKSSAGIRGTPLYVVAAVALVAHETFLCISRVTLRPSTAEAITDTCIENYHAYTLRAVEVSPTNLKHLRQSRARVRRALTSLPWWKASLQPLLAPPHANAYDILQMSALPHPLCLFTPALRNA